MTASLRHVLPGGAAWSAQVARGRSVTFTTRGDGANVSLLIFAAQDRVDRLNIPDTLKSQYSACIRAPMVLMSDRGTGLVSVTGSSLPWHDALCGHGMAGHGSYAAGGNTWRRSARMGLLSELRKNGRDEPDLHASVNLFSKVALDDSAGLSFVSGHSRAGDWVTLRTELDVLLVLTSAPHPMDPAWAPAEVEIVIAPSAEVTAEDPSRVFRPESARALDAAEAVFA